MVIAMFFATIRITSKIEMYLSAEPLLFIRLKDVEVGSTHSYLSYLKAMPLLPTAQPIFL